MFFNDIVHQLTYSKIIKYADDTVIHFSDRDVYVIENALNKDLELISKYFDENELIINVKRGKTESMLFGTAKRLSTIKNHLEIDYKSSPITFVKKYKYLGYIVDNNLLFTKNFDNSYKRASGRLKLLTRIRAYLTTTAAEQIYKMMIVPLLTYSSTTNLVFNRTQSKKLQSINNRGMSIVNQGKDGAIILSRIENLIHKESCLTVRKCLDLNICENFHQYFHPICHNKNTRNNVLMLKLPISKLEISKKAFYFAGARIYNNVPVHIRKEKDFNDFKTLVKQYFV